MAFFGISDMTGDVELLVFPSVYEQTSWLWAVDKVVFVEGTVNGKDRDGKETTDVKITVSTAREILREEAKAYKKKDKTVKPLSKQSSRKSVSKTTHTKPTKSQRVYIRMISTNDKAKLSALKEHIDSYPGETEVVLVLGEPDNKKAIRIPEKTQSSEDSVNGLVMLYGAENVKVA